MNWLERGFQRNTAGLLDQEANPDMYNQMLPAYKRAVIADALGSLGGSNPGHVNQTLGRIPGLLEQQQAAQRQAANQQVLAQYAEQGVLQPHQQALLGNNPELMEHFFKERYTGRNLAPGATYYSGGRDEFQAPNRPQVVGTDLVDPNTKELLHRAPQNPGVSVNVGGEGPRYEIGSVPPGYRQVYDEMGRPTHQEVMPGSPAQRELERQAETEEAKRQYRATVGGTVVQDANRALHLLEGAGFFGAGAGARVGQMFTESDASTINNLVESIKGNIGVDQLQAMRESSPTGGALGNVTERQLQGLQGLLGRLDITGRPEELEANLKRIHNLYMDQVHGTPEQIEFAGRALGLPDEQVQQMMFRYDLPFDEFGRPRQSQAPAQGPAQMVPDSGAPPVRRWNPQTGRLE